MVRKIKRPSGPALPIKPTGKPSPQEVMLVTQAMLDIVQRSLLNPAAVISALKCAEATYCTNAETQGMSAANIENSQVLGITLSKVMLKAHEDKTPRSGIVTPDSRLIGPDGQPLVAPPPQMHSKDDDKEETEEVQPEEPADEG
jgi:hypothetical protein